MRGGGLGHARDLRDGASVWTATRSPAAPVERLRTDLGTDVLVIGAGISGALVAENLSEAGLGVVVVDRRGPFRGSTAASTALLQYELDTPLVTLARARGGSEAERIWTRSWLAVAALVARAHRLGIDADIVARQALYLAGTELDARALAHEAVRRRRAGFELELLGRSDLRTRFGLRRSAAILGFGDHVADPRKLTAGFLAVARSRGARVFAPVEVVQVEEGRRGVLATTDAGLRIRARHVVYATGYELPDEVKPGKHAVATTWAIATRPQRRALWPTECMIWEASSPYLYLRTTPDGRVICGGEDEPFESPERRDRLTPRKVATLERKLGRLFPALDPRADYHWAGNFGTSPDGTPSIGPVPRRPRSYAVVGYGGNGITFSMLGAQLIRAAITGEPDTDSALFALR